MKDILGPQNLSALEEKEEEGGGEKEDNRNIKTANLPSLDYNGNYSRQEQIETKINWNLETRALCQNGEMRNLQSGKISSITPTMCRLKNMTTDNEIIDTLHLQSEKTNCSSMRCLGSVVSPSSADVGENLAPGELRSKTEVLRQSKEFIITYYKSLNKSTSDEEKEARLHQIHEQVKRTGTYEMTEKELAFGARLAWRNASRCIGRIQWKKLQLFDCRHCRTPRDMFECVLQHLKYASNKGNIRSTISIFPQKTEHLQEFRIWNSQLIRYAGYKQLDGSVIGDPASLEITNIAMKLGWKGSGTAFDILPLILQASGSAPEFFEIPKEYVLEVNITHPNYPEIDEMGLKWYGVPCVADIALDCGGLQFTACPFNGWYMATEISARNLTDTNRYNLLKPIAKKLGFDTTNNTTLWKDKVTLELTSAVLHSFKEAGVTMVDHHTASESFMKHLKDEERLRGGCPSDWVWIVPPISGSICPVFHQEMLNYKLLPGYVYQEAAWKYLYIEKNENKAKRRFKNIVKAVQFSNSLFGKVLKHRTKVTVLYATETGKSQAYAKRLNELFLHAFDSKHLCMEDYDINDLDSEQCVLMVASTFGNGEPPDNGQTFLGNLRKLISPDSDMKPRGYSFTNGSLHVIPECAKDKFSNVRFAVFGLGSRAYPKFCQFARTLDGVLESLGCEKIFPFGEGDELCAQEESFNDWARGCFEAACEYFAISDVKLPKSIMTSNSAWKDGAVRFKMADQKETLLSLCDGLLKMHKKNVCTSTVISVENLQTKKSDRVTNLVRLSTADQHGIDYEPGDHLYIFPHNNIAHVNELLRRVRCNDIKPDDLLNVEMLNAKNEWQLTDTVPMPTTLHRIFEYYLDITTPPSMRLLRFLSDEAENEEDLKMLLELGNNTEVYDDWKVQENPTLLEVLQRFPSVDVDVLMLISRLPILKPRAYSISSSPKLHPNEVHITVALVTYSVNSGALHHGVCSSYLNQLHPGNIVHCFVKSAHSFRLPESRNAPIMLVGPGTGIAPFRAFWQQFIYEKNSDDPLEKRTGDVILYFGCRHPRMDNIYKNDLQDALKCNSITKLYTAYSKFELKPKTYVQNLLAENYDEVCDFLMNPESHFYVCGDVTMAADVCRELESILIRYQAFSEHEAQTLTLDMKKQGRYHEDIFGVTLKVKEITERARFAVKRRGSANSKTKSMKLPINQNQLNNEPGQFPIGVF